MKAEAWDILNQATLKIPAYTLDDRELWTFKLVKLVLIDTFRMLRPVEGQVGPGRLKAAWPVSYDPRDYPPREIGPHPTAQE